MEEHVRCGLGVRRQLGHLRVGSQPAARTERPTEGEPREVPVENPASGHRLAIGPVSLPTRRSIVRRVSITTIFHLPGYLTVTNRTLHTRIHVLPRIRSL